jgi:antidote-toxin recognition MazE-like antitoxin
MASSSTKRVQKHRAKMKAAGLKRVTIWVQDVNAPGYAEKVAEAIAIVNASADEKVYSTSFQLDGWKRTGKISLLSHMPFLGFT